MDVLGRLLTGDGLRAGTPGPMDDYWYRAAPGISTIAGMRVDADGAKKISAWFRGRDILATSLAMLPLQLLERLPDDQGASPAKSNPLYDILHRKPNASDDSFTWRRRAMFDLIDHGHHYDFMGIGSRWSLDRIDPTLVTWERLTSGPNRGRSLYHVRDAKSGVPTTYTQDEVFHLRGADGKGILESARDSLGVAMAVDQYAARIFSRGTLHGGTIEVPGQMDPESARAMAQSFVTAAGEWHMPKVLPMGAKMSPAPDALTPEKAQMLLSRKFSINEIARWLGLPPHMIGDLDRATFSNIEHQGQEFVTYSLGPWLSLWEFAINDQLILQPNRFYAEFTRDALVRGDLAARWAAYQIAVTTGVATRNEVRRRENWNALEGLDEPLDPAFITGKQAQQTTPPPKPSQPPAAADDTSKAEAIVVATARRILTTEIAKVQKLAVQHAADADAFAAAVTAFYSNHASYVERTLMLSKAEARGYCADQASQVLNGEWVAALEQWATDAYAAGLAALALEEAA